MSKLKHDQSVTTIYTVWWFDEQDAKNITTCSTRKEARLVKKVYRQYHPEIKRTTFDHGYILESQTIY